MGFNVATKQVGCNAMAVLVKYAALFTGAGAGTTGANEAAGGSYARVSVGSAVADGLADNNFAQIPVYAPAGVYTEGGGFTTPTGIVLSIPASPAATGSGTGGTFAAGTYYWVWTATNFSGETTVSSEVSAVLTGSTSSSALSCAVVTGATGYNLYRGLTSGGENRLVYSGSSPSYTDTGTTGTLTTLPTSNKASTFVYSQPFTGGPQTISGSNPFINVVLSLTVNG